jgi:hypothetical protein
MVVCESAHGWVGVGVGGVGEGVIDLCECRCERKGVRLGVGVGVWVSGLRCGANAMRTGVNGEGEEVIPS